MKKTGLFKIIVFIILAIVLLTWLIPGSYFDMYTGQVANVGRNQIGFFDFFQILFGSFEYKNFIQIFIFILSVGAFYGVLSKTGKYRAWIEKIASKFKGKEKVFLISTAVLITILSSVFSYGMLLFIFIPLIIGIILSLGYDKITAALATFGAIIVGTIGSTISYSVTGMMNEVLKVPNLKEGLVYRIVLLVLSLVVLVYFLYKAQRNTKKNNEELNLFIGEKNTNKYSVVHIIVTFSILFVLMVLACTSWSETFNVQFFANIHKSIMEFTIKDFPIFAKIFGNISAFGYWLYSEMAVVCLIAAFVIGKVYRFKISEVLENMVDGIKRFLAPAFIVFLVYTVLFFAGNSVFYATIADFILNTTSKFSIIFSSITTFIGSLLHVDVLYLGSFVIPQIALKSTSPVLTELLIQGIYGFTMLIAPTSAIIVLGLSYLEIPYSQWLKRVWKLAITLLVTILVITTIVKYTI